MKKILLFILALVCSSVSFAQLQLATLEHNDSISVFYGSYALEEAHAAAVNGDVVTLSPGSFTFHSDYRAGDITKNITIRGAGMFVDTMLGTTPTTIDGSNLYINVQADSIYHLSFEGIKFNSSITANSIDGMYMTKCITGGSISTYSSPNTARKCLVNSFFTQCLISSIGNISQDSGFSNNVFTNCVILSALDRDNVYNHCVVGIYGSKFTAYNCVLYIQTPSCSTYSTAAMYNCIGFLNNNYNYFGSQWRQYNMNISGDNTTKFSRVFKTFTGSSNSFVFSEQETFALTDSIMTAYPGSDGTPVGIYGGVAPFNPRVGKHKVTVPSQTTLNGRLNVRIEAIDE